MKVSHVMPLTLRVRLQGLGKVLGEFGRLQGLGTFLEGSWPGQVVGQASGQGFLHLSLLGIVT